jgi:hypothetical protein
MNSSHITETALCKTWRPDGGRVAAFRVLLDVHFPRSASVSIVVRDMDTQHYAIDGWSKTRMTARAAHLALGLPKMYHALTMHSALNWLWAGSSAGSD